MFSKWRRVGSAAGVMLAALLMAGPIAAYAASSYTTQSCTSSVQYGQYSSLTNSTPTLTTTTCTTYQHNPVYRTQPTYGWVAYTATRQVLQSQAYTAYRWGVTGSHQAVVGTQQVFAGYRYQPYQYLAYFTWRAVVYGYGYRYVQYAIAHSGWGCKRGTPQGCSQWGSYTWYTYGYREETYPLFYYARVPVYATGYTEVAQFKTVPVWGPVPTYGWIAYTAYREVLVPQTYTAYRWGVTGSQQVLANYSSTPIGSSTTTTVGSVTGDPAGSGYYPIPVPQN